MSNLSSKAAVIAFGAGIAQLITVLSTVILARILTQADLGTYKQIFLIYHLLAPIFITGIPASIYYFLARLKKEDEKKLFVARSISLLFILGLLLGVFVSLSSLWAPKLMQNPQLGILLIVFGVYAFAHVSEQFFQPILVLYNRVKMLLVYPLAKGVLIFSFTIASALIFNKNLVLIVLSVSLISLLLPIFAIVYTKNLLSLKTLMKIDLKNYKAQLAYGIPLALTSVVGIIAWEFDKLVVSINFPPELYAVYVLGATEIPFVGLIRSSVTQVILPEMSREYAEGKVKHLVDIWHNSIRKLSIVILPIFVLAMVFSKEIITTLYSEKFASSVPYFRIYLLLLIVRVASYGIILQAIGKTRENLKGSVAFFTVNAVLNPVLVVFLGLIGPAIATVISTFTNVIYYIVVIKRFMKFSLRDIFPWYSVSKNFFIAVLAGIVFVPIILFLDVPDLPRLIASTLIYSLVYFLIIYKFAILTDADKRFIKRTSNKALRLLRVNYDG
ncbi:MAG: oligosaccharide flippase family protein [Candidatus Woykebacteria bacterium]